MPSIVDYRTVYGVINHCESIGATFEVFAFVVSPLSDMNFKVEN